MSPAPLMAPDIVLVLPVATVTTGSLLMTMVLEMFSPLPFSTSVVWSENTWPMVSVPVPSAELLDKTTVEPLVTVVPPV
jgi:hypothetical protein